MQNFRNLVVWQKSHQLTLDIYKLTSTFPKDEIYGLTSQIRRSTSSIAINIAEGCGRFSNPDIAKFFQDSFASAQETEYILILTRDLKYIGFEHFTELEKKVGEIKAILASLLKKLRA